MELPPPDFAPLAGEYVCGRVHLQLAPLTRGLVMVQFDQTIQPHTTVQSSGGLDWTQRPGAYMQAQSRLQASLRCRRLPAWLLVGSCVWHAADLHRHGTVHGN